MASALRKPRQDMPGEDELIRLMEETQRALRVRRALALRVAAQAERARSKLDEDLEELQRDLEERRDAKR